MFKVQIWNHHPTETLPIENGCLGFQVYLKFQCVIHPAFFPVENAPDQAPEG